MIYQHPLAYLLGLEGAALMRAFNGEYGREFTMARIAEIRDLLDSADEIGDGVQTPPITTIEGYRAWAADYDQPGNNLIDMEQPVTRKFLAALRGRLRARRGLRHRPALGLPCLARSLHHRRRQLR